MLFLSSFMRCHTIQPESSISHSTQLNLKLSTFCPNTGCAVYAEGPLYRPSQSVVQLWNGMASPFYSYPNYLRRVGQSVATIGH